MVDAVAVCHPIVSSQVIAAVKFEITQLRHFNCAVVTCMHDKISNGSSSAHYRHPMIAAPQVVVVMDRQLQHMVDINPVQRTLHINLQHHLRAGCKGTNGLEAQAGRPPNKEPESPMRFARCTDVQAHPSTDNAAHKSWRTSWGS